MLFVPPSMPFMVPEAEAQSNDTDTTPPTIWFNTQSCIDVSAPDYHDLCLPNTTITRTALNSTGYNFYWHPNADDDVSTRASGMDMLCTVNNVTVPSFTDSSWGKWQHNHLFPIGTSQVICTAYDAAGNTSSAGFVVNVLEPSGGSDTTPPVVTTLPNVTLLAIDSTGFPPHQHTGKEPPANPNVYTLPTATDNVGVNVVTCTPAPGSQFPIGATTQYPTSHGFGDATTVTCSATDAAGNVGTASFTVTVLLPQDWVTLTASAYTNATSPTGRTLSITLGDTPETASDIFFNLTISKDGSVVLTNGGRLINDYFLSNYNNYFTGNQGWSFSNSEHSTRTGVLNHQISIPADWEAGTYDITWISMCCHASDTIHGGTTVTIPALQAELTMNSLNISEFDNFGNWAEPKVKYNPIGDFDYDAQDYDTCLLIQVLKPDGTEASITYDTACVQHQGYNFEGYINDAFNASGWTMKICDYGEYNVCVEQNFTISFAFLDAVAGDTTPPTITVTAYTNATSPTGRTLTVSGDNLCGDVLSEECDTSYSAAFAIYKDGIQKSYNCGYPYGSWSCLYSGILYVPPNSSVNYPDWVSGSDHWQMPIPTDWAAGTYDITWSTALNFYSQTTSSIGEYSGSISFTMPAPPAEPTPTITASAYLNATSSTGRTLTVSGDNLCGDTAWDLCDASYTADFTIYKDGITKAETCGWQGCSSGTVTSPAEFIAPGNESFWESRSDHWQIPIPTDWEAGTYDITWSTRSSQLGSDGIYGEYSGSISITIPALPTPTLTVTAYTNATSPTGRTMNFDVDLGSYDWLMFAWFNGTTIHGPNGVVKAGFFPMITWSPTLQGDFPLWNGGHLGYLQLDIPTDWVAGTYVITWNGLVWGGGTLNQFHWGGWDNCTVCSGDTVGTPDSTTVTIPALPGTEAAEEEIVIPSWIKNNAGWWADGQIDDRAFVSGLQWLISNGIMNIPPTVQGAGSDDVIPSWIKNNAGWWADDLIDDRNFVTGLQWLITNGIMIIELE